jgi:hypothetical protein
MQYLEPWWWVLSRNPPIWPNRENLSKYCIFRLRLDRTSVTTCPGERKAPLDGGDMGNQGAAYET